MLLKDGIHKYMSKKESTYRYVLHLNLRAGAPPHATR